MYWEILLMGSPYLSECFALIDDLGLVPSDSPQGRALACFHDIRFCEKYKRAKAVENKEFQERFYQRFKKYSRVSRNELGIDYCELRGLFD